jgi:hypothetical protein
MLSYSISFSAQMKNKQFSLLMSEGKRTLGRFWQRWKDNSKMDFTDSCGSGGGSVVGPYEYGTTPSGTTQGEN